MTRAIPPRPKGRGISRNILMKKAKRDTLTLTVSPSLRNDIDLVSTSLGITPRSLMLLCVKDRLSREDTYSFMYRGESHTETQSFQGDPETFSKIKKRADTAGLYVSDYVRTAFETGVKKYEEKVKPHGEPNAHLLEEGEESESVITVRLPTSLRRVVGDISGKINMSNQAVMRSAIAYQSRRAKEIEAVLAEHGDTLRTLARIDGVSSFMIAPTHQPLKLAFDSEVEQMPRGVTIGLYTAAVVHDLIYNKNAETQPFMWVEGLKDSQAARDYVTLFDSLLADKELELNAAQQKKRESKNTTVFNAPSATPNEPPAPASRSRQIYRKSDSPDSPPLIMPVPVKPLEEDQSRQQASPTANAFANQLRTQAQPDVPTTQAQPDAPTTQAQPPSAPYMGSEERIAYLLNQVDELINQQQVKGVPFKGLACVETFIETYDELLNPELHDIDTPNSTY